MRRRLAYRWRRFLKRGVLSQGFLECGHHLVTSTFIDQTRRLDLSRAAINNDSRDGSSNTHTSEFLPTEKFTQFLFVFDIVVDVQEQMLQRFLPISIAGTERLGFSIPKVFFFGHICNSWWFNGRISSLLQALQSSSSVNGESIQDQKETLPAASVRSCIQS